MAGFVLPRARKSQHACVTLRRREMNYIAYAAFLLGFLPPVAFCEQTSGVAASCWALLSQPNRDSVGIFAIFRQTVSAQPQEAVIPAVSQFSGHFLLPFDNTLSYSTGIALANPTSLAVVIPANIRNAQG